MLLLLLLLLLLRVEKWSSKIDDCQFKVCESVFESDRWRAKISLRWGESCYQLCF